MKHSIARTLLTIAVLTAILVTAFSESTIATASAATYNPYAQYYYQYPHPGTVLCTQATIRSEPSTNAKELGKVKNGQALYILGIYNEWYIVNLESCGYQNQSITYGFVKEALIEQDPSWIVLTQYTYMYATPWQKKQKRNGEQSGRVCLIIEESYPFYAVQCKETTAGSSFIYQWDIGKYSKPGQNLYVIVQDKTPVLDTPSISSKQIKSVDKFTIVNVDAQVDVYSHVTVNIGSQNEFYGWVKTQYLQKIIN